MQEALRLHSDGGPFPIYVRRCLIGFPLVVLPLLLGGARPWFWSMVASIFMIGGVALVWSDRKAGFSTPISWKAWALIAAVLAFPFLQIIPLPLSWLSVLSPSRLLWLQRAEDATHLAAPVTSISYVPLTTVFSAMWWLFLAGYALLLRAVLLKDRDPTWLYGAIFLFAGFEAFYGLLQVLIPSLGVFGYEEGVNAYRGTARGTFVNRNHYAAFLGMVWPVLVARLLTMTRRSKNEGDTGLSYPEHERLGQIRQKQLFLAVSTGIILLALIFSKSRGGIIGALVSLTVLVSLGGIRRSSVLAFVVTCWMVAIAYGSIIGFGEILSRFDLMETDAPGRFKIWEDTARMIEDHPLAGVGLGGYRTVVRMYQTHLTDQLQIGHAHNDYLELIAELGVPMALGIVLFVWGYWWKTAIRAVRHKDEVHLIAVGALAGSAAFLCHGWVEFNWQIPANQLYFVVMLVLMSRRNGGILTKISRLVKVGVPSR